MTIYSGFSHWKWWFSIVMLVYQRYPSALTWGVPCIPTNIRLVGGFNLPLWKMMDFVSWDDDQQIPNCFWKVIIHSWFQSPPTSKKKSWIQRTQAETDLKILSFIKVFYCFFNGFLWFFMVFYALETSWTLPERWILRLSPSHLHDVTGHLCRGMIGTAQPMLGHPMVGDVPGRHPPDLWTSPRCWRPNALQGCNSGDFHQSHGVSENIPDNMGSAMICWFELIRKCPHPQAFSLSAQTQHLHGLRCDWPSGNQTWQLDIHYL